MHAHRNDTRIFWELPIGTNDVHLSHECRPQTSPPQQLMNRPQRDGQWLTDQVSCDVFFDLIGAFLHGVDLLRHVRTLSYINNCEYNVLRLLSIKEKILHTQNSQKTWPWHTDAGYRRMNVYSVSLLALVLLRGA